MDNYLNLDARGTIIKIPRSIIENKSQVISRWIANWESDKDAFYINRDPNIVHNLVNYVSGYKYEITDSLYELCDELMIETFDRTFTEDIIAGYIELDKQIPEKMFVKYLHYIILYYLAYSTDPLRVPYNGLDKVYKIDTVKLINLLKKSVDQTQYIEIFNDINSKIDKINKTIKRTEIDYYHDQLLSKYGQIGKGDPYYGQMDYIALIKKYGWHKVFSDMTK
jgi:hypothetical protein